jgi:hypothetical protein
MMLWARLRGSGQEAFIVGGTQTYPGRFVIHAVGEKTPRNCSQYELAAVSVETALWLSGYLYGGVPRWPSEDDQRLMREWREKREIFLRSGAWPGRDDYATYGTGHTLSHGDEVHVRPRVRSEELEELRDRIGVIHSPAEREEGDDQLAYLVGLDQTSVSEFEVCVIAEGDLVTTGSHRPDYEPDPRFACPCCGFLTLRSGESGSYEICKVCYWEDDQQQLHNPDLGGGANAVSLNEARETFGREGVSEVRFKDKVRRPAAWEYPRPVVVGADGAPVPFGWPRLDGSGDA